MLSTLSRIVPYLQSHISYTSNPVSELTCTRLSIHQLLKRLFAAMRNSLVPEQPVPSIPPITE
jgi:hypothetical protein